MFSQWILLKKGIRRDSFWIHRLVYTSVLKHIPLFFDTYAVMRSQYWSRATIERYQERRLVVLFAKARKIPFWKSILRIESLPRTRLSEVPITSKNDFVSRPIEDVTDVSLLSRSDTDHTSGSTGKPFHFYHDWGASLRSCAITERIFRTATYGKRYPIVYMRSKQRHGFTFYKHFWFFLKGYTSVEYRMDEFKALGERFKDGFVLYGYTSWVVEVVRHMEKLQMVLPIKAVMVAGEHLVPDDRAFIERVLKVPLYTLYASREVGFLGYECEKHKMHISEDWAVVEVVDENGVPVAHGKEGRIVVTVLDNYVMPFIRYELGDVGSIDREPCACGRTFRTLSFRGRTVELIQLEDNRVVSLLDIAYALGTYKDAIRQYQIIQTSAISFVMKVVRGPSFDTHKEFLEPMMVRLLHPRAQVRWEFVEVIPEASSGKAVYFLRDFNYS